MRPRLNIFLLLFLFATARADDLQPDFDPALCNDAATQVRANQAPRATRLRITLPAIQTGLHRHPVKNLDAPRIIDFMNRARQSANLDVHALAQRAVDGDLIDGNLEKNFSGPRGDFILLEDPRGHIKATAAITASDPDVVELRKLYVDPSLRGSGVGWSLLMACVEAARASQAKKIILKVNKNSVAAISMYSKATFKKVGEIDGYGRITMELVL